MEIRAPRINYERPEDVPDCRNECGGKVHQNDTQAFAPFCSAGCRREWEEDGAVQTCDDCGWKLPGFEMHRLVSLNGGPAIYICDACDQPQAGASA